MPEDISNKLVIAISSRALFNLDEGNEIFENEGVDAYSQYQIANENNILEPGVAFSLVKKLLRLNDFGSHVEVILLSRNSADTGLRAFNSIQHYQLNITRAAFCNGKTPYPYIKAFGAHLFLSAHSEDVRKAIESGCAAATILTHSTTQNHSEQLRIAFDGDAVLFSDESERVFQEKGLDAFVENETISAHQPLPGGPFKDFLVSLHRLQRCFSQEECPIRTALITARSAPTHERVVRTLRAWDIRIDEAIFLGGLSKRDFLGAFRADIFFDDQLQHCQSASTHVATGHVPHGIIND